MGSSDVSIVNAVATISLKNLPWPKNHVQALNEGRDSWSANEQFRVGVSTPDSDRSVALSSLSELRLTAFTACAEQQVILNKMEESICT